MQTGLMSKRTLSIGFLLIVTLAFFLRFYNLGAQSYWQDEIIMVNITTSGFSEIVDQTTQNARPPLYVVASSIWASIFGTSEVATRSLPMIFSVLATAVFFILVRDWYDEKTAIIATLFMALSTFQIHHGQNHRYYALVVLNATASTLFFFRAIKNGHWRDFILWILLGTATFYSHTYGIFLYVAQGIFFILQFTRYRSALVKGLISVGVIVVLALPGIYWRAMEIVAASGGPDAESIAPDWIPAPTIFSPILTTARFFVYNLTSDQIVTIIVGAVVFVLTFGYFLLRTGLPSWLQSVRSTLSGIPQSLRHMQPETLLALCWYIIPITLVLAVSFVAGPLYLDRYLIISAPALYILVALFLLWLSRIVPLYSSLGALLIMLVIALGMYYTEDKAEPWREVADFVASESATDDAIIISHRSVASHPSLLQAFEFYYEGDTPVCDLIESELDDAEHVESAEKCIGDVDALWYVVVDLENASITERIAEIDEFLATLPTPLTTVDEQDFNNIRVLHAEPIGDAP
ncbi:MAG: hypothetical protein CL607_16765 [Anaerolineaceae bacterium]|nr:hypothetical protein [Anaerolineaceae bacterium]